MDTLKEIIDRVSDFPELYIGKPSVERLYAFIMGFLYQNSTANDHCLDGFTEYIAQKYSIHSDHNWASIIQFFSTNEQEAFSNFIQHFKEYSVAQEGQGDEGQEDGSSVSSP